MTNSIDWDGGDFMSSRPCRFCGGAYDEVFCPRCRERFVSRVSQFEVLPTELEPFYDEGTGEIEGWDYEKDWGRVEIVRRQLYKDLHSAEASMGSEADQEKFREEAKKRADEKVNVIIREALPRLRSARNLYAPPVVPNDSPSLNEFKL